LISPLKFTLASLSLYKSIMYSPWKYLLLWHNIDLFKENSNLFPSFLVSVKDTLLCFVHEKMCLINKIYLAKDATASLDSSTLIINAVLYKQRGNANYIYLLPNGSHSINTQAFRWFQYIRIIAEHVGSQAQSI